MNKEESSDNRNTNTNDSRYFTGELPDVVLHNLYNNYSESTAYSDFSLFVSSLSSFANSSLSVSSSASFCAVGASSLCSSLSSLTSSISSYNSGQNFTYLSENVNVASLSAGRNEDVTISTIVVTSSFACDNVTSKERIGQTFNKDTFAYAKLEEEEDAISDNNGRTSLVEHSPANRRTVVTNEVVKAKVNSSDMIQDRASILMTLGNSALDSSINRRVDDEIEEVAEEESELVDEIEEFQEEETTENRVSSLPMSEERNADTYNNNVPFVTRDILRERIFTDRENTNETTGLNTYLFPPPSFTDSVRIIPRLAFPVHHPLPFISSTGNEVIANENGLLVDKYEILLLDIGLPFNDEKILNEFCKCLKNKEALVDNNVTNSGNNNNNDNTSNRFCNSNNKTRGEVVRNDAVLKHCETEMFRVINWLCRDESNASKSQNMSRLLISRILDEADALLSHVEDDAWDSRHAKRKMFILNVFKAVKERAQKENFYAKIRSRLDVENAAICQAGIFPEEEGDANNHRGREPLNGNTSHFVSVNGSISNDNRSSFMAASGNSNHEGSLYYWHNNGLHSELCGRRETGISRSATIYDSNNVEGNARGNLPFAFPSSFSSLFSSVNVRTPIQGFSQAVMRILFNSSEMTCNVLFDLLQHLHPCECTVITQGGALSRFTDSSTAIAAALDEAYNILLRKVTCASLALSNPLLNYGVNSSNFYMYSKASKSMSSSLCVAPYPNFSFSNFSSSSPSFASCNFTCT